MKEKIILLLKESKDYVSGQELCEKFGVSRTAIWKAIEQLKKEGYEIDAIRNRGYKLAETDSDIYSKIELDSLMDTKYIGRNTFFYEEIGSTNTEAKRLAEEGLKEGVLVFADQQTAGKGRRGRAWISPKGKNIYYTLMLKPKISPDKAPMLTLIMALSVLEGMKSICPQNADDILIKWPNDIVLDGKKVCGMLTEMSVQEQDIQHVVIGVGINVKQQDFESEIADKATSIEKACGTKISRCKLIAEIMKAFEGYYEDFVKNGNLLYIKEEYEKNLANCGRKVCVLDPKGEFTGTAKGINDNGELLVEKEDGQLVTVYAGEVSVRGIYGYV